MKHENDQHIEQAASAARTAGVNDIEFCKLCEDEPVARHGLCEGCHEHHGVVSILERAAQ